MVKKIGIIDEIVKGYGDKFPSLEKLFELAPDRAALERIRTPIPALGRYYDSVKFLEEVTSGRSIGTKRFKVIIEYAIALSKSLGEYSGGKRKVISRLSARQIRFLRQVGQSDAEIYQADYLENFSDHDTAAYGDYLKFVFVKMFPELEKYAEGIYFANTSEDVMGNVFGMIGNELVYDHFIPKLLGFCMFIIQFVQKFEAETALILPALTHEQAAEYTTLGKKFINSLITIEALIRELVDESGYRAFSGKFSGATGGLICHYAAYPEIDWPDFAKKFVEGFGLKYEEFTNQSVSYAREVTIFSVIANILNAIVKFAEDFVGMASCPSQFFVKEKRAGVKGSSIMPNKYNAWRIEGAIGMLLKTRSNLLFLCERLPRYPYEGNMERSFLMRDIGNDFMPAFIALDRITREMKQYHPDYEKVLSFFNEYPGMAGSAIQTILKREGVHGDAYRMIQNISINSDGSYANKEQFDYGLKKVMEKLKFGKKLRQDLWRIIKPFNLTTPVQQLVNTELDFLSARLETYGRTLEVLRSEYR